jgi:hypothetical protein
VRSGCIGSSDVAKDPVILRQMFTPNVCRVKVPTSKPVESLGGIAGKWYAREMPMSFMIAMENLTDPSHLPFSHHGISPGMLSRFTSFDPFQSCWEISSVQKCSECMLLVTYAASKAGPSAFG